MSSKSQSTAICGAHTSGSDSDLITSLIFLLTISAYCALIFYTFAVNYTSYVIMFDIDFLKDTTRKMIELARLQPNEGQLDGLPKNPREIDVEKFELLKQNLQKYPKLLKHCTLLVFPLDDENYIIIGGNMRYHALNDIGEKLAPCDVIDSDTDIETLKAYIALHNSSFGKWDFDLLANNWDSDDLKSWGLDLNFDILEDEPSEDELDGDDRNKPFTAKLTFSSEVMLKKFIKEQEQMLADEYGCAVSYSGGEL